MKRLELKYYKKGKEKCFKDKFERCDGKELKRHFRGINLSLRLCFEMYSWLANESNIIYYDFGDSNERIYGVAFW